MAALVTVLPPDSTSSVDLVDREECPSLCDVIRRGLTFHISSLEEIRPLKYSSSNRCPEGGLHGQCRGGFRRGRKDGLSSVS